VRIAERPADRREVSIREHYHILPSNYLNEY
jgi:hypothetical protein